MNPKDKRLVAIWLSACCLLVFSMILLGGVTRLTHSGLSMVDWDPIMGVIPPLNEGQWRETFERYKDYPEYQVVNKGMGLDEFKRIFYFEYGHRVLGRSIGIVFLLPFLFFLFARKLDRPLVLRLSLLFVLGGAQGLLGWYMVMSGLVDVPRVSAYRLTAHLMLAVLILGYMLWLVFELTRRAAKPMVRAGMRTYAWLILVVVAVMIASGGFVAGTRAGFAFNTFPKMYDRWIPEGLWALQPTWANLFENVATVQFIHRCLAYIVALLILGFWGAALRAGGEIRMGATMLLAALAVQVALGISTLLYSVPVSLAAAHQGGALVVFSAALYICHLVSRERTAPD
ncbi:COX15/CtaA family protein [Pseudomonadota bacterium]